MEQTRRFRRVHTTTNLSGCLGRMGERRGAAQSGCPASPCPPGSTLCSHSPPPGAGMDSPLSEATGSRVGLRGRVGPRAEGQRPHVGQRDHKDREQGTGSQQGPCKRHSRAERRPFTHNICEVLLRVRAEQSRGRTLLGSEQQRWGESANQEEKYIKLTSSRACTVSLRLDVGAEA